MELTFALFADHASVPPDGKLYILGGGFSGIMLPQLPGQAQIAVAAQFRFIAADAARPHTVELRLVDADGRLVLPPATLQFQASGPPPESDGEVTVPIVTQLAPMFGSPGHYAVEFWYEGRLLESLRLRVLEQPAQQPSGPSIQA